MAKIIRVLQVKAVTILWAYVQIRIQKEYAIDAFVYAWISTNGKLWDINILIRFFFKKNRVFFGFGGFFGEGWEVLDDLSILAASKRNVTPSLELGWKRFCKTRVNFKIYAKRNNYLAVFFGFLYNHCLFGASDGGMEEWKAYDQWMAPVSLSYPKKLPLFCQKSCSTLLKIEKLICSLGKIHLLAPCSALDCVIKWFLIPSDRIDFPHGKSLKCRIEEKELEKNHKI